MDVALSAVRLGAKRVRIVYRRRAVDMMAMPEEVEGAREEGCEVLELCAPLRIEKDAEGRVAALCFLLAGQTGQRQRRDGTGNPRRDYPAELHQNH